MAYAKLNGKYVKRDNKLIKIDASIDSNIKPENIKKDIEILGVKGIVESLIPAKSWLYITEYDSNGNPIKAKTIGCSGNMPFYLCGYNDSSAKNILETLIDFEINDGVTNISFKAFQYCTSLTSIIIPDSVVSIEEYAFYFCENLKSITIPNSVTGINNYTFYNCRRLTSITIPDGLISIGGYAFQNCSSLPSIVMPSALTSISGYSFSSCSNLSLFDFRKAKQVPSLGGANAFNNTPSIKKIVVPDSLYDTWITSTNWSSSTNNIVTSIIKASDYEASL